jgi:hypothetical protein
MDHFRPGAYGVVARHPSGAVAVVERNFRSAAHTTARTLRRFQGGEGLVASIPRGPDPLRTDYDSAFTARLLGSKLDVVLVRFAEDTNAEVPLREPRALVVIAGNRVRRAMVFDSQKAAATAEAVVRRRFHLRVRVDVVPLEDRRPQGGLLIPSEERVVSVAQAVDAWTRRFEAGVDFDAEVARLALVRSA